jgi:signal peptidase I
MLPTILLADPSIRLAGVRFGARVPRERRIATKRRVSRSWLALGAVLATAFVGMGYLGTWPPLATVMSASMEPTIKTGDIVVLKKLQRAPRIGDIVAVSVPPKIRSRFGYPPVIIHRIVHISDDGVVNTKGDAFKEPDPFDIPTSALHTRVVATVPAAGRVFAFLGSTLGMLWLAGGALLLIGMPMLDHYRSVQRRGLGERGDMQSVLQHVTEELALARTEREGQLDDAARQAAAREQLLAAGRDAAIQAAASAQEQLRLVSAAFAQHLEALPAQIERAIADAFAAAAPPPPPPPPPAPVAAVPTPVAAPAPVQRPAPIRPAPPAPTPDLFVRRFVAASQFTPPPTPDLLSALTAAQAPVPWDAPPPAAPREKLFA